MTSNQVKQLLSELVADTYVLYIKTQKFHWNVEGACFVALHSLFGSQYEGFADAVDEIAERLRMMGNKAPGSLSEFADLATIKDSLDSPTDRGMVEQLVADNEELAFKNQQLFDLATSAGDAGTADMAGKRVLAHQKNSWMLRSLLKSTALG